jgi:hypothetical protein
MDYYENAEIAQAFVNVKNNLLVAINKVIKKEVKERNKAAKDELLSELNQTLVAVDWCTDSFLQLNTAELSKR